MPDMVDLATLARRHSYKWRAFPPEVLPAFVAEMDFLLPECVRQALHDAVDAGDCGYASNDHLGEAFAVFVSQRHHWEVDPARVFLLPDVMTGVDELLGLFTRPGDGVIVNTPIYPPFLRHVVALGRQLVEVPLQQAAHRYELDLEAMEAAFAGGAKAYLLCNPHNPTGRVFSRSELDHVAELAERFDAIVISDEIHAPLTLAGAQHIPYVALGSHAAAHGVTLTSASKAFNIAGLKCAVMVGASETMRRHLESLPAAGAFRAGLFGVIASVAAWQDGGPWLDGVLDHLDTIRKDMTDLLAQHLPQVAYEPPEAGYLAWLDCRHLELGEDPSAVFLERGSVALGRGLDFGSPGAGFVRVTMGTSREILAEIVERMASAVEDR